MKPKTLIILSIIFIGIISSCSKPLETISNGELVNLIETNQVKQIDVVNRQDALIILKKELNKPKLKMHIGSMETFAKSIITIAKKHNVLISYTHKISGSSNLFMLTYPLMILALIILYFIGGIVCLYLTMKNEFNNPYDKIAWVITIIFAPVIGVLLFILLGRKQIKTTHRS